MNTEDLIDDLARNLAPAPRLPSPRKRAARWLLGAAVYAAALAWLAALHVGSDGIVGDRRFWLSQAIAIFAAALAALAAFASVVPGASRRTWAAAGIALAAWIAAQIGASYEAAAAVDEWSCIALVGIGGAPLLAALAALLRRGAPLNPRLTAALGGLSVGMLVNVAACLSRPHPSAAVTLLWHGAAVAGLALVCVAGAHGVLRWRTSARAL
jgi:hypothetical protein